MTFHSKLLHIRLSIVKAIGKFGVDSFVIEQAPAVKAKLEGEEVLRKIAEENKRKKVRK